MSWDDLLLGFLMYGLPWSFVAVGGWLTWKAWSFMRHAERVKATVMDVKIQHGSTGTGSSRRHTMTYRPVFAYQDARGTDQRAETFLWSSSYNFDVGTTKEILVDPREPDVCRIPGFMIYGFGALFLLIGLLFGIGTLFIDLPAAAE